MLSSIPALLSDTSEWFWFPPKASTFAEKTDSLYMAILYISIFFFVLIVAAMVYFAIKFRRRPGYKGDSTALHNNALEITWTVIPTIIACWIFAAGVDGYYDMMTPPKADTININVTAQAWDWGFEYPNGAYSDELHVPIDRAVKLRMRSKDYLHSFYVPAFRAKTDIVPGRVNVMWFKPILLGTYDLFCAEYCGDRHSLMIKQQGVFVETQEEYEAFLAKAAKPPTAPAAHGHWLYKRHCQSCHSVVPGKTVVGPSFANSFGTTYKDINGDQIEFNEEYIRRSIIEPQAQKREGFQRASLMTSFAGQFNDKEMVALSAFLESMAKQEFIDAVADGDLNDDEKTALGIPDAAPADAESGAGEETTPADADSEVESPAAGEPAAEAPAADDN